MAEFDKTMTFGGILKTTALFLLFPVFALAQTQTAIYPDKFDQTKVSACIESMCGPAKNNISAYDSYNLKLRDMSQISPVWQKDWQPFISSAINIENDLRTLQGQRAKDMLMSNFVPSESSSLKPLLVFQSVMHPFEDSAPSLVTFSLTKFDFVINDAAFEIAASTMAPDRKAAARVLLENVFLPIYKESLLGQLLDPMEVHVKLRFSKLSSRDALVADAKENLRKYALLVKTIKEFPGDALISPVHLPVAQKAARGENLSPSEVKNYLEFAKSVEMLTSILTDGPTLKAINEVSYDLGKTYQGLKPYMIKAIYKPLDNKDKATLVAECQKSITTTLSLDLTPARMEKAKKMIEAAKWGAKVVAKKLVNAEVVSYLENVIDHTQFLLPGSPKESLQAVSDQISNEIKENKDSITFLKSADAKSIYSLLYFLAMTEVQKTQTKLESNIVKACQKSAGLQVSDSTLVEAGKINVSSFSVAIPEIGISVVAHELGHIVAGNIKSRPEFKEKNKAFYQTRVCVVNRNPFTADLTNLTDFMQTTYSEEDWADYFSSQVMIELEKAKSEWYSAKNLACALVVDKGDSYGEQSPKPVTGDPHSSGFLRLLMVGADRGMMTPQCSEFVKYSSDPNRTLNCH
jgi:hypothetical protein